VGKFLKKNIYKNNDFGKIHREGCMFFFQFFFWVTTFDLIILWMMVTSATFRKLKLKKKEKGKSAEAHFTLGPKNWPNSKVHMGFGPKAQKSLALVSFLY
jgi:hypothetical protein